jgi:hypothetical protein
MRAELAWLGAAFNRATERCVEVAGSSAAAWTAFEAARQESDRRRQHWLVLWNAWGYVLSRTRSCHFSLFSSFRSSSFSPCSPAKFGGLFLLRDGLLTCGGLTRGDLAHGRISFFSCFLISAGFRSLFVRIDRVSSRYHGGRGVFDTLLSFPHASLYSPVSCGVLRQDTRHIPRHTPFFLLKMNPFTNQLEAKNG